VKHSSLIDAIQSRHLTIDSEAMKNRSVAGRISVSEYRQFVQNDVAATPTAEKLRDLLQYVTAALSDVVCGLSV